MIYNNDVFILNNILSIKEGYILLMNVTDYLSIKELIQLINDLSSPLLIIKEKNNNYKKLMKKINIKI
jgi:hypothetical protein